MGITTNPQFRDLIPPLSTSELAGLEASLIATGCRDKLIVWKGVLLDGHNRFDLCNKHGIKFETRTLDFESDAHAQLWISKNQLHRRNLTDDQRAMVTDAAVQIESKLAMIERASKGTPAREAKKAGTLSDAPSDKVKPKKDTRLKQSKLAGVSERKLKQARFVSQHSKAKEKQVMLGLVSLADVVRELKKKDLVKSLETIEVKKAKQLDGVYDVVVIDPPWPIKKIERDERVNQTELEYPLMSEEEIEALKIPCAKDCHVWLWTTHRFLPTAFRLLDKWNLNYVCTFVWHKPGGFQPIGLPQFNCEFALYARFGSPEFVDTKSFNVCFDAPRTKHSEKPEEFYAAVRRVTAGRRLDMFNRRVIEGFDGWGKESK